MVKKRKFVLTEGMSKTLPLEMHMLNIDDEWKHVLHASLDEMFTLKSFFNRKKKERVFWATCNDGKNL
jgi:hypothetical protein